MACCVVVLVLLFWFVDGSVYVYGHCFWIWLLLLSGYCSCSGILCSTPCVLLFSVLFVVFSVCSCMRFVLCDMFSVLCSRLHCYLFSVLCSPLRSRFSVPSSRFSVLCYMVVAPCSLLRAFVIVIVIGVVLVVVIVIVIGIALFWLCCCCCCCLLCRLLCLC